MNFNEYMTMVRKVPACVMCLGCGVLMHHMQESAAVQCPKCKSSVAYQDLELSSVAVGMTTSEWSTLGK